MSRKTWTALINRLVNSNETLARYADELMLERAKTDRPLALFVSALKDHVGDVDAVLTALEPPIDGETWDDGHDVRVALVGRLTRIAHESADRIRTLLREN